MGMIYKREDRLEKLFEQFASIDDKENDKKKDRQTSKKKINDIKEKERSS